MYNISRCISMLRYHTYLYNFVCYKWEGNIVYMNKCRRFILNKQRLKKESDGLLMSTLERETNNDFTGEGYTDVMLMCCSCTCIFWHILQTNDITLLTKTWSGDSLREPVYMLRVLGSTWNTTFPRPQRSVSRCICGPNPDFSVSPHQELSSTSTDTWRPTCSTGSWIHLPTSVLLSSCAFRKCVAP